MENVVILHVLGYYKRVSQRDRTDVEECIEMLVLSTFVRRDLSLGYAGEKSSHQREISRILNLMMPEGA